MASVSRLQFLRPCAMGTLSAPNPVYLRFYHLARSMATGSECVHMGEMARAVSRSSTMFWSRSVSSAARAASEALEVTSSKIGAAAGTDYPRMGAFNGPVRPTRIPELRARYHGKDPESDAPETVIRGRIHSVRRASSKLLFLDVVGEFERIQVMVNLKRLMQEAESDTAAITAPEFRRLSDKLQRGIFISVRGVPTRTSAGELTILATAFPSSLTPASTLPPPKSLTDDAATIQHRHLDLLANRRSLDVLRLRSDVIAVIRNYLTSSHFVEVQTPILAEQAGGAAARPFLTSSIQFASAGEDDHPLALRIAPELWLKRLVVGGFERVFEMGPCFRNEGVDSTHNPEFTMCEFYEAYATLEDLIRRSEELITSLVNMIQQRQQPGAAKNDENAWRTSSALPSLDITKFARPFDRVEFIPALEEVIGIRLPDLESETAFEDVMSLVQTRNIKLMEGGCDPKSTPSSASLSKLLDRLAAIHLEPRSKEGALFIIHHPACMSPLAKSFRCPRTGQLVAARAELFVDGFEVANMYEEENDPDAQAAKFADQRRRLLRRRAAAAASPSASPEAKLVEVEDEDGEGESGGVGNDASYVDALRAGLPPTGGWGCGIERLVMLLSGAPRIRDVLSFGTLRNVVGVSRSYVPVEAQAGHGGEGGKDGDSVKGDLPVIPR